MNMAKTNKKQAVNRDTMEVVGTILKEDIGRDAIHIAVMAVRAAHYLDPGEHIGLENGLATSDAEKLLGIVDPYLKDPVKKREMFLMHLYPRTIQSLKHVWAHPDIPEKPEPTTEENAGLSEEQIAAKEYLTDFAESIGRTYQQLIEAATDYIQSGETWSGGSGFEGLSCGDEFWDHYEKITGVRVDPNERSSFFSCSC
jgi:hypothetical protein